MSRDRGEYRAIYEVLYDGKDWCLLTPEARLVWLVLKGTLGAAGINAMPATEHVLASRTGYAPAVVGTALAELQAKQWIERDGMVLWVLRGLDFEPNLLPSNEKHRTFITRHLASLPRLAIVDRFRVAYPDWFPGEAVPPAPIGMPSEGVSKAPPITNTTTIPLTNPTTVSVSVAYHVRCVIALNQALRVHPILGSSFREIAASEMAGAVTWEADGIPITLVEQIIAEQVAKYRPTERNRQPFSLKYFDGAVRRSQEIKTIAATELPPTGFKLPRIEA